MDSSSSDLSDPPSSPLSVLTSSPTISPRHSLLLRNIRPLSPPSTVPSGSASPMKSYPEAVEAEICVNPDGPPPAKRRKTEPKPRTTEHLTLQSPNELSPHDDELLDQLTTALRKKKKIVVIAGAGISVSAGSMYLMRRASLIPQFGLKSLPSLLSLPPLFSLSCLSCLVANFYLFCTVY